MLTRSQVRSVLRWPDLIEATERALIAAAVGLALDIAESLDIGTLLDLTG